MRDDICIYVSPADLVRLERLVADRNTLRKAAIQDYLDTHNLDPKPFIWTKTADAILVVTLR